MMKQQAPAPEDFYRQINYPKDVNSMSDLEKKHWPGIECPDTVEAGKPFDVTVNIGVGIDHPSEFAHFIEWIEILRGDMSVSRINLEPKYSYPRATFRIALDRDTTLKVREGCNLHGVWENKKDIKVK